MKGFANVTLSEYLGPYNAQEVERQIRLLREVLRRMEAARRQRLDAVLRQKLQQIEP